MADTYELPESSVKELTEALRAQATPERPDLQTAKAAFCQAWPTAKPVLRTLGDLLRIVPGIGVFAGPAIGVVVAAGDAAHRALCS